MVCIVMEMGTACTTINVGDYSVCSVGNSFEFVCTECRVSVSQMKLALNMYVWQTECSSTLLFREEEFWLFSF